MLYTVVPAEGIDIEADSAEEAARNLYGSLLENYPAIDISKDFYVIDDSADPDNPTMFQVVIDGGIVIINQVDPDLAPIASVGTAPSISAKAGV